MSWDEIFIKLADLFAHKSKDSSTKVGCLIAGVGNEVLSMGFNGFARGVRELDPDNVFLDKVRWERPEKYKWVVHSEANAIANAARSGISLDGSTLYLNYDPKGICSGCAQLIIQAGIKKVVGPERAFPGKGAGSGYDLDITGIMFKEGGVSVVVVNGLEL